MKQIKNVVNALRVVIKYGALIMVVIEIISFAADKIEGWVNSKDTEKKSLIEN